MREIRKLRHRWFNLPKITKRLYLTYFKTSPIARGTIIFYSTEKHGIQFEIRHILVSKMSKHEQSFHGFMLWRFLREKNEQMKHRGVEGTETALGNVHHQE